MTLSRKLTKCAAAIAAKRLDERSFRYVVSSSDPDCEGDSVIPSGISLDAYRENPIVLLHHDTSRPVAAATRVWVDGSRLMADIRFPPEGAVRESDEAHALVSSGILSGASIGFFIDDYVPLDTGGRRITRSRLIEISLVSLACSHGARRVASRQLPRGETLPVSDVIAAFTPPRQLVTREQAVELVRRSAREAFRDRAVEYLCSESGALDESGLREKMARSPELAGVVRSVLASLDSRADAIASTVGERLP